jgi:hypothetical protein
MRPMKQPLMLILQGIILKHDMPVNLHIIDQDVILKGHSENQLEEIANHNCISILGGSMLVRIHTKIITKIVKGSGVSAKQVYLFFTKACVYSNSNFIPIFVQGGN